MRKYLGTVLVALLLPVAACSGEKEPSAKDSPPPSAEEIAYYDCLEKKGLKVEISEGGSPRLEKTESVEEITAAERACASLLPEPPERRATARELSDARNYTACMRAEGISWFPDPNPVSGEFDTLSNDQVAELKTEHVDVLAKCRRGKGQ
ncbi:hypothetical protein [Streptomyces sp. NPDC089799]|uniref:hypothetical protein n=1 Tax=Streptomyces sp. NPDC089799 TaxID=3155066 RepID=UPI00341CF22D